MSDTFCHSGCRSSFRSDLSCGAIYGAVHGLTSDECGESGALSHEEFYRRMGACPYCKALTKVKRRYRYLQHGQLQPYRGVTWVDFPSDPNHEHNLNFERELLPRLDR